MTINEQSSKILHANIKMKIKALCVQFSIHHHHVTCTTKHGLQISTSYT